MRTVSTLVLAAACTVLGGCVIVTSGSEGLQVDTPLYSNAVQGNGIAARDARPVAPVQALEVNGSITVEARIGPVAALVVEADSNLLPLIRTEVRDGTLVIGATQAYRGRTPVRVLYTAPRLAAVRHSGSGRLSVQGLDGAPLAVAHTGSGSVLLAGQVASLQADSSGSGGIDAAGLQSGSADLTLAGSGHVDVGQVRGEHATARLDGSGRLRIAGAVRMLTARANGSGRLDLSGLTSEQADLSSNGSGGITANVTRSLLAYSGGSGGIRVYGNPAQRSVSGKRVQVAVD